MTVDAPFHLERVFLIDGRHIVDLAMTCRTSDAFSNVNTVIEVNKFRKVVHTLPLDRFVLSKACSDGFEIRTVGP